MAKQLYDYWFVQFDFPNEEGKPYKSSGGEMVWNNFVKQFIPHSWRVCKIKDLLPVITGKQDANFATKNGKYKFFTCSQEVSNCNIAEFEGSAVLIAGNGDFNVKHYTGPFNAYQRTYVLVPPTKFYAVIFMATSMLLEQFKKNSNGSIIKFITKGDVENITIFDCGGDALYNRLNNLFFMIEQNNKEIEFLTKQRDELLPLLMNGQATINYHLYVFQSFRILYRKPKRRIGMKEAIIKNIVNGMAGMLTQEELECLGVVVRKALSACEVVEVHGEEMQQGKDNAALLEVFISAKKIEGCSEKTLQYYKSSIEKLVTAVGKNVCEINTNDIRCHLAELQEKRGLSKVTMDNLRRIYSSFFSWLEDEDYITKSPVRRIHKVRTDALVKEVLTDENIEVLRDSCHELRDIAMIDLLLSTGMRVGELVRINREDIDLHERQCVVFGKGNKEREVYFNARAKIHLKKYLEQRTDDNPALFVSLKSPYNRLTINGVEVRLRKLGAQANITTKVHPHKFRRTLATMAIDKGMPIEQVQKMLGHVKIDTTMHYAMVNQANVKIAHRKFIN